MPYNVLETIDTQERLKFSQNFPVDNGSILDTIFPNVKTQFWKAEFYRLMSGQNLPKVAYVHALDSEAHIGSRPGFEKVMTEKFLIKEKINQTEKLQEVIDNGVSDDETLTRYVFDDATRLFRSVFTRTRVMKGQALANGKLTINENNVKMEVDFGVPADAKVDLSDWSKPDADIMGDIYKMVEIAEDHGYAVTKAITSRKMINYMRTNTGLQSAVLGNANKRLLTKQELDFILEQEFGITEINACEEKFNFDKADGTLGKARIFKEGVFTLYSADSDGSFGVGLWGPTPDENEYRQFIEQENRSFVTLSMWATPDPVAVWTKASGMFVPVAPKANGGIVIGTKAGE